MWDVLVTTRERREKSRGFFVLEKSSDSRQNTSLCGNGNDNFPQEKELYHFTLTLTLTDVSSFSQTSK